jgi:hypothetical protein
MYDCIITFIFYFIFIITNNGIPKTVDILELTSKY